MTLAEQIKAARKEAGFTQKQVAEILGIKASTYSRYEAENETNIVPPVERLKTLNKLFGHNFYVEVEGNVMNVSAGMRRYIICQPIGTINLYPWQVEQAEANNKDLYFVPAKEDE